MCSNRVATYQNKSNGGNSLPCYMMQCHLKSQVYNHYLVVKEAKKRSGETGKIPLSMHHLYMLQKFKNVSSVKWFNPLCLTCGYSERWKSYFSVWLNFPDSLTLLGIWIGSQEHIVYHLGKVSGGLAAQVAMLLTCIWEVSILNSESGCQI
jgi:hypothetical protein